MSAITDPEFVPENPVHLQAPAGSVTLHHVRLTHGSAPNQSPKPRRIVCFIYCAMDAWPLLGVAGADFKNYGPVDWNAFNATLVRGKPCRHPRLGNVPVTLPLPDNGGKGVYQSIPSIASPSY